MRDLYLPSIPGQPAAAAVAASEVVERLRLAEESTWSSALLRLEGAASKEWTSLEEAWLAFPFRRRWRRLL